MIGLNIHGVESYEIQKGSPADVLVVKSTDGDLRVALFHIQEDQDEHPQQAA